MAWVFNLVAADVCFVAYMRHGIKTGDWREGWYVAVLFVLNLWAAIYISRY